jgi:uncharacterized protein Usg
VQLHAAAKRFWQHADSCANNLFLLIFERSSASISSYEVIEEKKMEMSETELMLKGYGLTTAEIFYRMPDYRHVLNSFVWQDYDLAPDHPKLFEFIEFWQDEIEGPLHSVRFAHRKMIAPGEWRNVVGELKYH